MEGVGGGGGGGCHPEESKNKKTGHSQFGGEANLQYRGWRGEDKEGTQPSLGASKSYAVR